MSQWRADVNVLALELESIFTKCYKSLINQLLSIFICFISGNALLPSLRTTSLYLSLLQRQLRKSVEMASKNTDSADLQVIVEMLKKQENNMTRRLDLLENKLDSFKLEITENIQGLEERVKVVEKSAEFIANEYESQKKPSSDLLKRQFALD